MNKNSYKLITVIFLGFVSTFSARLAAQDVSFSQFYASSSYLNPALTAIRSGVTGHMTYRNQWFGLPGNKSFETSYASVETEIPFLFGLGLSFQSDKAGVFDFKTNAARLSFSKAVALSRGAELHVGVSTGWIQRSIDWTKLVFSDQLDPIYGITRPTNYNNFDISPVNATDLALGVALRWNWAIPTKYSSYDSRHLIGFTFNHPWYQDESLQRLDSVDVPIRYTFHYGTEINTNLYFNNHRNKVTWSPNIKYDWQGKIKVLTAGVFVLAEPVYIGAFFQSQTNNIITLNNTHTLIFNAGVVIPLRRETMMNLGLSYDLHLSGFSISSNRSGTIELTATFNFGDVGPFGLGFGGGGSGGGKYSGGYKSNKYRAMGKFNVNRRALKCETFF